MSTIRYFIPEDGDVETQPNVFLAPKPRHQGAPPTLGQIKQAFPLPGRYHFRFKAPITPGGDREKHSLSVWMDCVDDRQPVPTWQSTIVAKVTRIGIDEDDDFEDEEEFRRQNITAPAPAPQQQPAMTQSAPPATQAPSLDIFDGPSPAASNGHHHHAPTAAPQRTAAPASGGDLLGDFGTSNGHHAAGPGANDFLGMTAPAATTPAQTAPAPPQQTRPPPRHSSSGTNNSFDKFSQNKGPFGDLNAW